MYMSSWGYVGRLAATYGLAVLGVFGGALLAQPFLSLGNFGNPFWNVPAMVIAALSPVPVIAMTALLKRDYGLTGVLLALPALLGTLFCTGVMQLLTIAAAAHMSL